MSSSAILDSKSSKISGSMMEQSTPTVDDPKPKGSIANPMGGPAKQLDGMQPKLPSLLSSGQMGGLGDDVTVRGAAEYLQQLIMEKQLLLTYNPQVLAHVSKLLDGEIGAAQQTLVIAQNTAQNELKSMANGDGTSTTTTKDDCVAATIESKINGNEKQSGGHPRCEVHSPLPEPEGEIVTLEHKIFAPVNDYPEYNFVGRILGPCGMTVKQLEQKTGCKIMVRGRGSKDKRGTRVNGHGRQQISSGAGDAAESGHAPSVGGGTSSTTLDGVSQVVPRSPEALHVIITVEDTRNRAEIKLERAKQEINQLLHPQCPSGMDEIKRQQLMELAIINGTYRPLPASAYKSPQTACVAYNTTPNYNLMSQTYDNAMRQQIASAGGIPLYLNQAALASAAQQSAAQQQALAWAARAAYGGNTAAAAAALSGRQPGSGSTAYWPTATQGGSVPPTAYLLPCMNMGGSGATGGFYGSAAQQAQSSYNSYATATAQGIQQQALRQAVANSRAQSLFGDLSGSASSGGMKSTASLLGGVAGSGSGTGQPTVDVDSLVNNLGQLGNV